MATVQSLVPKVAGFLVRIAGRRRLTTYGEVARAVGTGVRVVPKTLEVIRAVCLQKKWPALTSIVVSATTGKPGDAFLDPWLPRQTVAAAKEAMTKTMQDEVYAFNWTPLLTHFGCSDRPQDLLSPVVITFQAQHRDGAVHVTFPGGFQTTIDGSHADLFEHLRHFLIGAGQWPNT